MPDAAEFFTRNPKVSSIIPGNHRNEIDEYIKFFNEERPAYSLNYLTPKQFRETYMQVQKKIKKSTIFIYAYPKYVD